jgi:hypothetical protein
MTRESRELREQMRADGNARMLDEKEAQIKELRAEVERLGGNEADKDATDNLVRIGQLHDEVERLQETDRLREVAFQAYADQEKKDRIEIERLQRTIDQHWAEGRERNAEVERLTAERDASMRMQLADVVEIERLQTANDYAYGELAKLRGEIEWLRAPRFDVAQLQPDDNSPGLWIGFKTGKDRDEAMKLFRDPKP